MKKSLAFDIGAFSGDSTDDMLEYYDKVVCVDANLNCIDKLIDKYKDDSRVEIIHGCISDSNDKETKFYVFKTNELWSSIFEEISNREELAKEIYFVNTLNINTIIDKYGTPDYMKVDIEGADIILLNQLGQRGNLPKYISCESECLGKRSLKEGEDVIVLNKLKELGYNKFMLYNNYTKQVNGLQLDFEFKDCLDFNSLSEFYMSYDEIYNMIKSIDRKNRYPIYYFWCDIFATRI